MSDDVKLDLLPFNTESFFGFLLNISGFCLDEPVQLLRAFHDIPAPVVIELKSGVVVFSVVDRPGLAQSLIPVSAHPQGLQNIVVGIEFERETQKIKNDPVQRTCRLYVVLQFLQFFCRVP